MPMIHSWSARRIYGARPGLSAAHQRRLRSYVKQRKAG